MMHEATVKCCVGVSQRPVLRGGLKCAFGVSGEGRGGSRKSQRPKPQMDMTLKEGMTFKIMLEELKCPSSPSAFPKA